MLATTKTLSAILLSAAITGPAIAVQWTPDTGSNQLVTGALSDQNQVKVIAAIDGGFWVSWFDGIATGWDVRLQRYDAFGVPAFGPTGLLVADRSFSSTQDYGLAESTDGDALLAFRDDRSGSVEITAARVSRLGVLEWTAAGVSVTSNAGFVAAPKIVSGTGQGAIVAWTENNTVRAQWINGQGMIGWGAGLTITPASGAYSLADMGSISEDAIVSIVHQTGGFSSPRHLLAQRIDRFGNAVWGTAPVTVFDSGSLQFGNFPAVEVRTDGVSTFAWYSSSPSLQCFVQRLLPDGTEAWATGGVPVSTAPGALRTSPFARTDTQSGDVVVAWRELSPSQAQSGISAQRISPSGQRLWTDAGVALVPVGTSGANAPRVVTGLASDSLLVTWEEEPTFNADQVFAARLDASGAITMPRYDVASTASGKSRYASARSVTGTTVLAWSDARSDGGDIYLQALDPAGVPGSADIISVDTCDGLPNTQGESAQAFATGSAVVTDGDVRLQVTRVPQFTFAFFLASRQPGFSSMPNGSAGNLCLGGAIGRYVGPGQIQGSFATGVVGLTLDLNAIPTPTGFVAAASGERWYFQAWYRDVGPTSSSNFSSAIAIDFL